MIAVIAPLPCRPCDHRQIGDRRLEFLSCVNAPELPPRAVFVSGGV